MENIISLITPFNWAVLIITDALLVLFLVSSILEKKPRPAYISLSGLIVNSILWASLNRLHMLSLLKWTIGINLALLVIFFVMVVVSLVKFFPPRKSRDLSGIHRYDERDYVFSRNNLQYHPHLAEKYYSAHPEKREIDRKIHVKPEIGEPGHVFYDAYYSQVFEAAFAYLKRTRSAARGQAANRDKKIEKEKLSQIIREMAFFYGAVDVGITSLKPYHFFSHAGRHAENWGEKIENNHSTAIVMVVAMDVGMMTFAPALPAILESARQYVEAAKIANIIAQYLRDMGYSARAHTDANYEVMCVPAAVDAGLGTLGRIGLLMHPVYGPCVRLSVVTTDLELPPTKKNHCCTPMSIDHFCEICKKCADNCPTQSICPGEEPFSRGFKHWSINQETCFSYWKNIGTDCGFCIRVCPYTKPNTLMHQLVRFYISRNSLNQRIALFLDDLFYGRKQALANKNPTKIL